MDCDVKEEWIMARKATERDVKPGRQLWVKDHGGWRQVVVQDTTPSSKGIKVVFRDQDGQEGQRLLDALYRSPF